MVSTNSGWCKSGNVVPIVMRVRTFFVSQISQQHSIRGRPGGGQGRKADKPTRGLCNSTWYHDDNDKNDADDDHAMANVKAINF